MLCRARWTCRLALDGRSSVRVHRTALLRGERRFSRSSWSPAGGERGCRRCRPDAAHAAARGRVEHVGGDRAAPSRTRHCCAGSCSGLRSSSPRRRPSHSACCVGRLRRTRPTAQLEDACGGGATAAEQARARLDVRLAAQCDEPARACWAVCDGLLVSSLLHDVRCMMRDTPSLRVRAGLLRVRAAGRNAHARRACTRRRRCRRS